MKKILIIPQLKELSESLSLAEEYGAGFEYNDFFTPDILDSELLCEELAQKYLSVKLPEYCTLHGAFFDVIPFSPDKKIREVADLRIEQSISAAKKLGARAVVFHTNYNPFLNTPHYIEKWLEQNAEYWSDILTRHRDVEIYFENMFDTSPDILAELAKTLCRFENFGICFDYAHAAITDIPHEIWAKAFGKYTKHIHINDNDLKSDLHLAIGDGRINFGEFYELYEKYLNGASILIETSATEGQRRSLERLRHDGFI